NGAPPPDDVPLAGGHRLLRQAARRSAPGRAPPALDPLVRHPHGLGHGARAVARVPGGGPAGRERRGPPEGGRDLDHRRADRRPAVLRPVHARLLPDPALVAGLRGVGGRAGDPRRADRRPADRGHLHVAPPAAAPPVPGHRGAVGGPRPGSGPLGQLLQRGGVRAADRPPLEALHLGVPPAAEPDRGRVLPPDLPLRVALGPRGLHPADARPPAPPGAGAGRHLPGLPRPLLARAVLDRGPPDGQPDAGAAPGGAAGERTGRPGRGGRHPAPAPPAPPPISRGPRRRGGGAARPPRGARAAPPPRRATPRASPPPRPGPARPAFACLGSSGAVPSAERDTTALVVRAGASACLIDVGGSPVQKLR